MNTYDLSKQAISKKQQVVATHNGYRREMCPHTLGKRNGKEHSLFYQFAGESSSNPMIPGSEKNWGCMPVNGLLDVSLREGEWYTASNHSRPQTCIDGMGVEMHS